MADQIERMAKLKQAYQNTFFGDFDHPHVDGATVLADLKKFCQAEQPGMVVSPKSGMVDSHASLYRAGLRDAYLHITGLLGIDIDKLFTEVRHEHRDSTISGSAES